MFWILSFRHLYNLRLRLWIRAFDTRKPPSRFPILHNFRLETNKIDICRGISSCSHRPFSFRTTRWQAYYDGDDSVLRESKWWQ
jgi:hypothetical protein